MAIASNILYELAFLLEKIVPEISFIGTSTIQISVLVIVTKSAMPEIWVGAFISACDRRYVEELHLQTSFHTEFLNRAKPWVSRHPLDLAIILLCLMAT